MLVDYRSRKKQSKVSMMVKARMLFAACLVLGSALVGAVAAKGAGVVNDAAVSEKVLDNKDRTQQESERQKELADDTAKLLVLANELKAELDKSTKDTLSLTVVKKAEEVEKLAHRVKDEMKRSIGN